MTLSRPMFPPVADRAATCSDVEQVSTCASGAPVENGAKSEPLNSGGAGAAPPDGLYVRTDIAPETLFQALGRLRRQAAAEIERLIAFLDETDSDADLEPDGSDEPVLAAPENHPNHKHGYIHSKRPFRDVTGAQGAWASGMDDDREGDGAFDDREGDELEHGGDEHDGCEPDVCDEPSLGWTSTEAATGQYGAAWGSNEDLELEFHTGIADADGLMEQCPHLFDRANVGVLA